MFIVAFKKKKKEKNNLKKYVTQAFILFYD